MTGDPLTPGVMSWNLPEDSAKTTEAFKARTWPGRQRPVPDASQDVPPELLGKAPLNPDDWDGA